MRRRIAKTLTTFPWLVCDRDEEIAGYAYASPHRERAAYRWSVDVSAYVREAVGDGRRACPLHPLVRAAAPQGFYTALAGITLPNPGSVGLHESMGFEMSASIDESAYKCGQWHDVAWYQLALREYAGEPAEPLAFDRIDRSVRPPGGHPQQAGVTVACRGSRAIDEI